MSEIVFLAGHALEGGLVVRAHGHSIFTEAETYDDLRTQVRDAVRVHFGDADRPMLIHLRYVKDEVLSA